MISAMFPTRHRKKWGWGLVKDDAMIEGFVVQGLKSNSGFFGTREDRMLQWSWASKPTK